jgi:lipid-binding SYLF domain-containing protein
MAKTIFEGVMKVRRTPAQLTAVGLLMACLAIAPPMFAQGKAAERIKASTDVLETILEKQEIPTSIVNKATCAVVYPGVKKVGIGIGVTYGRGLITCRTGQEMDGKWSAPAMFTLDTGSLGVQLGSTSTDYVLLIMTRRGADKILSGKLKLGADASAVAGPDGAKAVGFNDPNVDVLAYSQAKGLFAGASIGSASMATDDDMNKELYGKPLSATQIVRDGAAPVPAAAKGLVNYLDKVSAKRN